MYINTCIYINSIINIYIYILYIHIYIYIYSTTSTWFSSAQNFFITKFLVNFCGKIRRAHTVLARSKM